MAQNKKLNPLMKTLQRPILKLCAVALLTGATAYGGSFTADFTTQDTSTFSLNGTGSMPDGSSWFPVIDTTRQIAQLTTNQVSTSGSLGPYDFDFGMPVEGFTAKFKLQFGPSTSTPADGLAFSFGPSVSVTAVNSETGDGSGVAVSFHTYTSNDGPAVDVYLYGTQIAHTKMAVTNMDNSQLQDVVIQLKRNSTLYVAYRDQVVYSNLFLPGWGPTNLSYNISARCGGLSEETDIGALSIDSTPAGAPVAPTVTIAPQDVTADEGASASFGVSVDGSGPFTFQWTENGNDIAGATNRTFTLSPVLYSDNNAKIAVKVTNDAGSITSPAATLTVNKDTTPPTVVKASGDTTFTAVLVKYSEPVSDTALNAANYSLDQGASVIAASRVDASTVTLTTSTLAQDTSYTLTINGVQDMAYTPNTIAANTKVQFTTYIFVTGTVVHKKYLGFGDNTTFNDLFSDPRFPNNPDRTDLLNIWEYPNHSFGGRNATADPARDYIDTIEGYFIAPTNGDYVFLTCGADHWWLFLSSDEDPANRYQITGENGGWTNPRDWMTGQGGTDMSVNRSDNYYGPITLQAGQKYYMIEVHQDPSWSGADDFAATYKLADEADPVDGDAPRLTGSVIGSYVDPTGMSLSFAQQPQNATAQAGNTATFSAGVAAASPYGTNVFYQWETAPKGGSAWQDISGATSASYTTSLLTASDDGTQYRLIATMAFLSATSSVATVTVTANTTPPTASAGAMVDSDDSTVVDVGVDFDKPMDVASITQLSSYSISSGTIASLTEYTNRFTADSQNPLVMIPKESVLLKVTGLTGSATLTLNNLSDIYGNKMAATTIPLTVNTAMKWGVVGANELGGPNAVVPVAANGWDVYSDGIAEWAQYDEATFVYQPVTGDFDKKVRVIYQDGSSTWARAGLVVRDVLNFGVDRATQTGSGSSTPPYDGKAGRYQKCHVNPVGMTLGGPGNAAWEGNRRLDTGGNSSSALTSNNGVPQYPNAWCRIKRVGQTFTIYRSDDGVNWLNMGSTTWGVDDQSKTPMPDTVYVGPEFSPENGNISVAADQGTFLAQFRDYGDVTTAFNPGLSISTDPSTGKVTISWTTGTLVSSPTVNGAYSAVTGATSPYVVTPTGQATFYRVQQ